MLNVLKENQDKSKLTYISPQKIVPNRYQPRKNFDESKLYELAQSIRVNGILQPLVVRNSISKDTYELIAGERRLRASILVGLSTVPVIIKTYSDEQAMMFAIIENIQRHDLTYFEEADSYKRLIDECHITQEELAKRLGKTQSTIANKLRLLKLDRNLRNILIENNLTERHARSLLKLPEGELRENALKIIIGRNLNVSQTEVLIMDLLGEIKKEKRVVKNKSRCMKLFRDVRILTSTINQTIDLIKQSGLKVKSNKKETNDFIEYVIRVDKVNDI